MLLDKLQQNRKSQIWSDLNMSCPPTHHLTGSPGISWLCLSNTLLMSFYQKHLDLTHFNFSKTKERGSDLTRLCPVRPHIAHLLNHLVPLRLILVPGHKKKNQEMDHRSASNFFFRCQDPIDRVSRTNRWDISSCPPGHYTPCVPIVPHTGLSRLCIAGA